MLFQLKKLPEIINLTRFLKSFWILYIDQIIVYNAFYSKLTFYIIKDRCQMHTLKVFRSPVWLLLHKLSSPHYRYIRKIRRGDRLPLTQRRAARYVTNRYHNTSSVSAMLNHLQLPTLEHRRNLNRITMLYKITNNLIAVDPKLYLTTQPYLSTRNNNPLQYQIISTRTNYYKYSFFPHAVVLWNALP